MQKVLVVGDTVAYNEFKDELRNRRFEVLEANSVAEMMQQASVGDILVTIFDIHRLNPEGTEPSDFRAGLEALTQLFVEDTVLGKLCVLTSNANIKDDVLAVAPGASFIVIPIGIDEILAKAEL